MSTSRTLLIDWQLFIVPGLFVLAGLVTGLVLERMLIGAARRVLKPSSWLNQESVTKVLKGVILSIFAIGGLYLATFNMPAVQEGVLFSLRKVLFIAGMLIAIRLVANILLETIRRWAAKGEKPAKLPSTSIFENVVRFIVLLIGMLVILQTLGISILPILTALGVGGLAISLALQDTLANLFAGINMILAKQIKVGDTVQLENGQTGVVQDIGWRTTLLKQLGGNQVIIPNSKMAAGIIINYTLPHPDLTVGLQIAVALDSDLDRVEAIATEVATEVGRRLAVEKYERRKQFDFDPLVRYLSYGESWINMAINLPFRQPMDAAAVRHELFKALHARFVRENIRLPFPQKLVRLEGLPEAPQLTGALSEVASQARKTGKKSTLDTGRELGDA